MSGDKELYNIQVLRLRDVDIVNVNTCVVRLTSSLYSYTTDVAQDLGKGVCGWNNEYMFPLTRCVCETMPSTDRQECYRNRQGITLQDINADTNSALLLNDAYTSQQYQESSQFVTLSVYADRQELDSSYIGSSVLGVHDTPGYQWLSLFKGEAYMGQIQVLWVPQVPYTQPPEPPVQETRFFMPSNEKDKIKRTLAQRAVIEQCAHAISSNDLNKLSNLQNDPNYILSLLELFKDLSMRSLFVRSVRVDKITFVHPKCLQLLYDLNIALIRQAMNKHEYGTCYAALCVLGLYTTKIAHGSTLASFVRLLDSNSVSGKYYDMIGMSGCLHSKRAPQQSSWDEVAFHDQTGFQLLKTHEFQFSLQFWEYLFLDAFNRARSNAYLVYSKALPEEPVERKPPKRASVNAANHRGSVVTDKIDPKKISKCSMFNHYRTINSKTAGNDGQQSTAQDCVSDSSNETFFVNVPRPSQTQVYKQRIARYVQSLCGDKIGSSIAAHNMLTSEERVTELILRSVVGMILVIGYDTDSVYGILAFLAKNNCIPPSIMLSLNGFWMTQRSIIARYLPYLAPCHVLSVSDTKVTAKSLLSNTQFQFDYVTNHFHFITASNDKHTQPYIPEDDDGEIEENNTSIDLEALPHPLLGATPKSYIMSLNNVPNIELDDEIEEYVENSDDEEQPEQEDIDPTLFNIIRPDVLRQSSFLIGDSTPKAPPLLSKLTMDLLEEETDGIQEAMDVTRGRVLKSDVLEKELPQSVALYTDILDRNTIASVNVLVAKQPLALRCVCVHAPATLLCPIVSTASEQITESSYAKGVSQYYADSSVTLATTGVTFLRGEMEIARLEDVASLNQPKYIFLVNDTQSEADSNEEADMGRVIHPKVSPQTGIDILKSLANQWQQPWCTGTLVLTNQRVMFLPNGQSLPSSPQDEQAHRVLKLFRTLCCMALQSIHRVEITPSQDSKANTVNVGACVSLHQHRAQSATHLFRPNVDPTAQGLCHVDELKQILPPLQSSFSHCADEVLLHVRCKDQKQLTFSLRNSTTQTSNAMQRWKAFTLFLKKAMYPEPGNILPSAMPTNAPVEALSQALKNVNSKAIPQLYTFAYCHGNVVVSDDGWSVYNVEKEFYRQGALDSGKWQLSFVNQRYEFSPTYPAILVVPVPKSTDALQELQAQSQNVNSKYPVSPTSAQLKNTQNIAMQNGQLHEVMTKCKQYRSKGRLPVQTYYHKQSGGAILRSSQALAGITRTRCQSDETYLGWAGVQFLFDARPKANAQANTLKGGGVELRPEDAYNSSIIFCDIENIHVMRGCLKKITSACRTADVLSLPSSSASVGAVFAEQCRSKLGHILPPIPVYNSEQRVLASNLSYLTGSADDFSTSWLEAVHQSEWLKHLQLTIHAASQMAQVVAAGSSVKVSCSDGWDRTAQLSALAQLLLDPYYRTTEGFCVLIEKDFCSFGHKFADRCGHACRDYGSSERSPIFIQFLDCVYQIMLQCASSFEFLPNLLDHIAQHAYSCHYGTFLFNTERERAAAKVRQYTSSLWTDVSRNNAYTNAMYQPQCQPISIQNQVRRFQVWPFYYRWDLSQL